MQTLQLTFTMNVRNIKYSFEQVTRHILVHQHQLSEHAVTGQLCLKMYSA